MRVQITPAYPPSTSGIGDYAAALVDHSLFAGSIVNTIVVAHGSQQMAKTQSIVFSQQTRGSLSAVLEEVGANRVLLHYSGYGYARWGLCHWLVSALQDWMHRQIDRRITTIFHETYASGPIWRSAFWTTRMQRKIALELTQLTNTGFVTTNLGCRQLTHSCIKKPLELLPVFSNVGEPLSVSPITNRRPHAVIFGGIGTRQRAYKAAAQYEQALVLLFDQLQITDILDIGLGSVAPTTLAGRPVRALGALPAKDISDLLAKSKIGIIDYPVHCLAKSGVAAAYFAHGILLVTTCMEENETSDILEVGHQLLSLQYASNFEVDLVNVANAGHLWYQPNRVDAAVRRIANTL
jgi:hypothetical protein